MTGPFLLFCEAADGIHAPMRFACFRVHGFSVRVPRGFKELAECHLSLAPAPVFVLHVAGTMLTLITYRIGNLPNHLDSLKSNADAIERFPH